MTESTGFQLLISTFDDETAAPQAVAQLSALFRSDLKSMPAVASVVRSAEGTLTIQETSDIGAKQGAAAGALAGGLLGLLSRKRGVVGSAAVGALLGGVLAHKVDTGIPDPRLEAIGQSLENATSAVVAIVNDEAMGKVRAIVDGFAGATVTEAFDHKTDFIKQIQSGDYAGALTALANQTEGKVSGAKDVASSAAQDLTSKAQQTLNRNKSE